MNYCFSINFFYPVFSLFIWGFSASHIFCLSLQLDPFTPQTCQLLSVLLPFNFLSPRWGAFIHMSHHSLFFPSLLRVSPSENESAKLVSLSEHVIIPLPQWRRWRRQMGCKVFHSGGETATCESQNVWNSNVTALWLFASVYAGACCILLYVVETCF